MISYLQCLRNSAKFLLIYKDNNFGLTLDLFFYKSAVKFQIPFRNQILRPNAAAQQEMFVGGLAEILLKASEGDQVTISLKF